MTFSITRSVVPSPNSVPVSVALSSRPESTMLAWFTSPVSVVPCVVQNGQATAPAAQTASARATPARDNPRRIRGQNIGGTPGVAAGERLGPAGGEGG